MSGFRQSRAVPVLTWHLARAEGRRGVHGTLLAVGASAVSALLLLLLLAFWTATGARADRTAWRTPVEDPGGGAIQVLSTTSVRGRLITVVDLAGVPGRPAPAAPPGLATFPAPGQVYLSPALADLVERLPATQLADRFPHPQQGYSRIGNAGLADPDELVAVIGRTSDDPAVAPSAGMRNMQTGLEGRATISSFAHRGSGALTANDRNSAVLAAGVLLGPILVLAAAAGRLGASRREQRLAALRLAGATPVQILAMSGLEAAAAGVTGAVAGSVLYGAALPLAGRVRFGIGAWSAGDLWVGLPAVLALVVVTALLAAGSAVSALRRAAVSPLGTAHQAAPRHTRGIRLVLFTVLIGYLVIRSRSADLTPDVLFGLLALFYGAFWILGPWVTDRLGRITARIGRRPASLLAARSLSDDPHGAWRTISGLVLAGAVAGFFGLVHLDPGLPSDTGQVAVVLPDGSGTDTAPAAADRARRLLAASGITAQVSARPDDGTGDEAETALLVGQTGVVTHVVGGPSQLDTTLTALHGLVPGRTPYTTDTARAEDRMAATELGQLGLGTLTLSFLLAAASAGLTSAASVLDRRRVHQMQYLAGTPLSVQNRARILGILLPLIVLAGGTTGFGVYAAFRFSSMAGTTVDGSAMVRLGTFLLIGTAAMLAAVAAGRPLLRAVTTEPLKGD